MNSLIVDYINGSRKTLRERSRIEYARDLNQLDEWLSEHSLSLTTVTTLVLQGYLRNIPVSKRHTDRKLSVFKSFFSNLQEVGIISSNPTDRIKRFSKKSDYQYKEALNKDDLELLLDICGDIFEKNLYYNILSETIVKTFYYTGIRHSELISIDKGDVKDNRKISILGKGGKRRDIAFSIDLLQQFETYSYWRDKELEGKNEPAWFISPRKERITTGQVDYIFTKIKKRTNRNIHPHRLRHTFATQALDRGMNLEQVRDLLGHSDISTTGIYVHITEDLMQSYDRAFPPKEINGT